MIMRARLPFFSITILLVVLFPSFLVPNSASALGAEPPRIGGHTEDGHAVVDGEYGDHESDPDSSSSDHLPADDIPRLTADMQADPVSDSYKSAVPCKIVYVGKASNSPVVSDDNTVDNCPLPPDPQGGSNQDPGRIPTTRDMLYLARAVIHADGAGLYKRPDGVSYTNKHIPTLVAATRPTQTHVVTMFGREVTVTFTATSYTWSWGDGTPDLTTTSPGVPWHKGMKPNTDPTLIRHYYTPPNGWRSRFDGPYPNATRTITLTTTWAGTATNPFTGETQTINGLVTTTETTGPFRLSHLLISNTDTWEESQGH